jgi:hypothetical protein
MDTSFDKSWRLLKTVYCDHCGEPEGEQPFDAVTNMPVDFDSGNAGESASLCPSCKWKLGVSSFFNRDEENPV